LLDSVAEKVEIGNGKDSMQRKTTWDVTKESVELLLGESQKWLTPSQERWRYETS
jgi:hypothetical protein